LKHDEALCPIRNCSAGGLSDGVAVGGRSGVPRAGGLPEACDGWLLRPDALCRAVPHALWGHWDGTARRLMRKWLLRGGTTDSDARADACADSHQRRATGAGHERDADSSGDWK
jgi:hypothetical protein